MNFDIFFPVQIWQYNSNKYDNLYRLEAPSTQYTTDTSYRFLPHFLDHYVVHDDDTNEMNEDMFHKVKQKWILKETIWVINPKYIDSFAYGYQSFFVVQNNKTPFHTLVIYSERETLPNHTGINQDYRFNFQFGYLLYAASNHLTTLLYIRLSRDKQPIDIVLGNKYKETKLIGKRNYNFLPYQENKNVPFYDIQLLDINYFLYVFLDRPKGNYWKLTDTLLCLPTTETSGKTIFTTSFDCFQEAWKKRNKHVKDVFLQDPLVYLDFIMQNQNPNTTTSPQSYFWNLFFCIIIIILSVSIIIFGSFSFRLALMKQKS